jgi:hypothetical protein
MISQEQIAQIVTTALEAGEGLAGIKLPKREGIKKEFIQLAVKLCQAVEGRSGSLTNLQLSGMVIKLGRYAAKQQWMLAKLEERLSTLTDAVTEELSRLTDPTLTLQKILKLHKARNQQAAARLRRELAASTAPEVQTPVLFRDASQYQLVECLTEYHLKEETAALGHCVGGTSLDHYRARLANGESRIFSLRTAKGMPLVTIEYDVGEQSVTQIEKEESKIITGDEPFFPALCGALHALTKIITVGAINNLPAVADRVLLSDGSLTRVKANNLTFIPADMLSGTITVTQDTSLALLQQLAANPRIRLDVTALEDLSRLPFDVRCHLFSKAKSFIAPHFKRATRIEIEGANHVDLSSLETVELVAAKDFNRLDLSNLRRAELISLSPLSNLWSNIVLPRLEKIKYIEVGGDIGSVALPELKDAGSVTTYRANSLIVPKLETANDIYAPTVARIDLSALKKVERLILQCASNLELPRLENADLIEAGRATAIIAPNLRQVGEIKYVTGAQMALHPNFTGKTVPQL